MGRPAAVVLLRGRAGILANALAPDIPRRERSSNVRLRLCKRAGPPQDGAPRSPLRTAPMLILFTALVLLLAVAPQMGVWGVMRRHAKERADLPGGGGEFARHVLDAMKLGHVRVEETAHGDHYAPAGKAVRLTPQNMRGRSLTAVV